MVAAHELSSKMSAESGVQAAAESFHANLPLEMIRCDVLPHLPAAWECKRLPIKLSKVAAQVLIDNSVLGASDIRS
jgi:hypothetical protein